MKPTSWLLIGTLALAGCTGDGIPQGEYDAALDSAKKLQMQVEDLESQLEKAQDEAASAASSATPAEKVDTSELEKQIDDQLQEIEAKQKELDQLKDEFRDYKSKYRLTVREKIIGTKVAVLKTAKGEFKDVEVKEFSAVGLRISHSLGFGRVRFEDLDKELQDKLGYDKEEADAIIAQELADKAAAEAAVAALKKEQQPTPEKQKAMSKTALERKVAQLDSWLARANIQYRAIKREAMGYEAKARYAKSRGRVSYWGPKAEEKNRAADAIQAQIRTASRELKDLRRKLRSAK